jgi:hypothetical protein
VNNRQEKAAEVPASPAMQPKKNAREEEWAGTALSMPTPSIMRMQNVEGERRTVGGEVKEGRKLVMMSHNTGPVGLPKPLALDCQKKIVDKGRGRGNCEERHLNNTKLDKQKPPKPSISRFSPGPTCLCLARSSNKIAV